MELRLGQGYDVHRLVEGRKLLLGGVSVPFEKGLLGHSDADVLCHAIADAILGALALGDIGEHFPDSDPAYKGMSSLEILRRVVEEVIPGNARIVNVDATVVAQRPKVSPYIPAMRAHLAEVLRVHLDRVSVKATTTEGLGFEGLGEGIAAQAVVLVNIGDQ
jgi:2-C-methyl-D-erythritol 2,4-cyclodiphosphate synthase